MVSEVLPVLAFDVFCVFGVFCCCVVVFVFVFVFAFVFCLCWCFFCSFGVFGFGLSLLSEVWKNFSEIVTTFGNFGNSEIFGKQRLSKSCLEGPHSELIGKQVLLWTTHKHFKPTVTMKLLLSLDYCF